ncbi:MAG: PAS domain-containing protein [Candidatus Wallbacteria bacterium]|nr:PAS domain-containing protein [Candidatus Wallbacteria bacterium]
MSWRVVLDAIPIPVFVVDDDMRIKGLNAAGAKMIGDTPEVVLRRKSGDVLHCIHFTEHPAGCGRSYACQDCLVRGSVTRALTDGKVVRRRSRLDIVREGHVVPVHLLVTASPLPDTDPPLSLLMLEDIGSVTEILGLVPVCAWCKRLRTEEGNWESLETYLNVRLELDVTHALCPECHRREFADV